MSWIHASFNLPGLISSALTDNIVLMLWDTTHTSSVAANSSKFYTGAYVYKSNQIEPDSPFQATNHCFHSLCNNWHAALIPLIIYALRHRYLSQLQIFFHLHQISPTNFKEVFVNMWIWNIMFEIFFMYRVCLK